ncbi:hypothetical protein BDP27DRAFT_1418114 [Rhodocollybia butyracea]|uniref:Uncharacterized protein n=1 Tax=Rhodocollybia butyracea TaxID=206335 RepID=A0A9P5Q0N0_9AGAR|nr:hypothetical protein BDP27DRAFT_1418114 [Rhodocollybia butyracea]
MVEHDFDVSTVYSYENEARIAALAKVDVTGAMQDQVQVGDGGSLLDVVGPSKAQNAPANVAAEPQRTQLESVTPARAKKNLTPKRREHWKKFQEHIKFEQKERKARAKAKLQETGQAQSDRNATVELAAKSVAQPICIKSKAQQRRENKEKHAQANLIDLQSSVSTLSGSHTPPFSPGLSIAPPLPSPSHKPTTDKPFSSFSIYS